ncbi:hypothetical protein D3C85_707270 [compost metagenome]
MLYPRFRQVNHRLIGAAAQVFRPHDLGLLKPAAVFIAEQLGQCIGQLVEVRLVDVDGQSCANLGSCAIPLRKIFRQNSKRFSTS